MPKAIHVGRVLLLVDRTAAALGLLGVQGYRRYISPYKGFRCAHGALTGQPSCSEVAVNALRRHRFTKAIRIIRAQLTRCRATYLQFNDVITSAADHVSQFPALADGQCCQPCDCLGGVDPGIPRPANPNDPLGP